MNPVKIGLVGYGDAHFHAPLIAAADDLEAAPVTIERRATERLGAER